MMTLPLVEKSYHERQAKYYSTYNFTDRLTGTRVDEQTTTDHEDQCTLIR